MLKRDLLKLGPLALAAAVAATPAAAASGSSSEEGAAEATVNLSAVALPIIVDGRIRNYVFVTLKLHLAPSADLEAVRSKEAWFRDAMVRAAHRRSFAAPDSLISLNEPALCQAMMRAGAVLVGEGKIARIEVFNQMPRRRTGLV